MALLLEIDGRCARNPREVYTLHKLEYTSIYNEVFKKE